MLGDVTRQTLRRRQLPSSVKMLSGHQRAQAELCVVCWQRVKWGAQSSRARFLPEAPVLVEMMTSMLPKELSFELGVSMLPTSICSTCVARLRSKVIRPSWRQRLITSLTPSSNSPVSARTRHCKGDPDSCTICSAARISTCGIRGVKFNARPVKEHEQLQQPVKHVISSATFAKAATVANHSARSTLVFAAALGDSNEEKVAPGLKDALLRRNKMFAPFLRQQQFGMAVGSCVTFIGDVRGACTLICEEQNLAYDDVTLIRGSVDGGGGSLKISFSFLTALARRGFSESGVRHVYVFCLATGVAESYHVVEGLLNILDVGAVEAAFLRATLFWAQDTKMNWIFSGKSHGGSFPCIGCLWRPTDRFGQSHTLCTVSETAADARSFQKLVLGKPESFVKANFRTFHNCVRKPLLRIDNTLVLEVLTPNPLHIKLRTTNKLVFELEKAEPNLAGKFLKRLSVDKERYHGEFEGRACSKIVRGHDTLRMCVREHCLTTYETRASETTSGKRRRLGDRVKGIAVDRLVAKHPVSLYADAFQAFDGIMHFSYGLECDERYRHCFADFQCAIDAIKMSVTVSMHMLCAHVEHFCDSHKCGLLLYSEETPESLHGEVTRFKARWKVPQVGRKQHAPFMRNMVSGLNAAHVSSP